MLTSNLEVDDKKLYVELQKPFDAIYNYNKSGKWGRLYDVIMNLEPMEVNNLKK